MKVEGWLFLGCGVFFIGADVVYWYTSYDPTGTTALALAVGLALLVGFYVLFTGRRLPPRPEDNPEGEIVEGTGEIGFFSPHSWWPLFLGFSGAVARGRVRLRVVAGADRPAHGGVLVDRLRLRVLPGPLQPLRSARHPATPVRPRPAW